jgi:hypothetical protein
MHEAAAVRPTASSKLLAVVIVALGAGTSCKAAGNPELTHECVMNGLGKGTCTFTNSGTGVGAECGKVVVKNRKTAASKETSLFCSGQLAAMTTVRMEFEVVGLAQGCEAAQGETWSDVCGFEFQVRPPPKP